MSAKNGHERHGTDPGLHNTVVRYRDNEEHGEPGWYITTKRKDNDAMVTSGPYLLQELEPTLQPIDGRGDDDDHQADLTPEEVAIEEGHVTRIEAAADQVGDARSTGKVKELEARKKRLTPLMTAIDDYEEWCAS